jgi:hypothetical protein
MSLLLAVAAGAADARADDHGGRRGGDVRVTGNCGRGATSSLRLRSEGRTIEARFRVRQARGRGVWRITIVHEDRVSAHATRRITRSDDSFEVRRTIANLRGSDTVVVHAWGPHGLGCRATATLS